MVYLRQSSMVQVRDNTESTSRQYALADTAVELGWAPQDMEVIDADLGLSGKSAAPGKVSASWCPGSAGRGRGHIRPGGLPAGPVLGRLRPAGGDRPAHRHAADRQRRGLRPGGLQRLSGAGPERHDEPGRTPHPGERLQAAKRAAAERGDLRTPLPVGLVHDDDGSRDRPGQRGPGRGRRRVRRFAAGGSAYGVVAAFAGRRFPRAPTAARGPASCAGAGSPTPGSCGY